MADKTYVPCPYHCPTCTDRRLVVKRGKDGCVMRYDCPFGNTAFINKALVSKTKKERKKNEQLQN